MATRKAWATPPTSWLVALCRVQLRNLAHPATGDVAIMNPMRPVSRWSFILALLLAACGGATPTISPKGTGTPALPVGQPQQIAVTMSLFKFEPSTIAVKRGEPVQFALENVGGVHTFTIAELNLDITLQEGQAFRSPVAVPSRDGEFRLVCRFHELSGMTGILRVGQAAIIPGVASAITPSSPALTPAATSISTTTIPPTSALPARETNAAVQELAELENYAASRFYPDRFIVVKDIPVRLYITRLHREHVNRFTIEPFVRSTAFFPPGTRGVIEFIHDRSGEFRIRNEGHGYEAALSVVGSTDEAMVRSAGTGIQEFSLIHDFSGSQLAPQRLVVQRGVPVKIFNTGLGGQDKVSIAPFYLPTATNVEQGKITIFEFTPIMAGEFPISYQGHNLTGTLVVQEKP